MQTPRSACKAPTAYAHHDNRRHPCQYFHPPHTILFTDAAAEPEARFVVILLEETERGAARLAIAGM